jgi:ribosomal protein L11 methyltransferase
VTQQTGAGSDWLEISVTTDGEAAEAVVELFNRHGYGQAVVEIPVDLFEYELDSEIQPATVIVKTYLRADGSASTAQRRVEEGLWHLGRIYPIPDPVIRVVAEKDWTEAWKQQYQLQRVGRRTVIVPAWEGYTPAPGEIVMRLEPGMAFGTGLHPTTRLCLRALEDHCPPEGNVLDLGTGSGVLAIAAAKLGARSVLALDADHAAVSVARENVQMNGVEHLITVRHGTLPGGDAVPVHFLADGSLDLLDSGRFDLILVNILAHVIIGLAPAIAARLAPGGTVIAAGLIDTQEQSVTESFEAVDLRVVERSQEKDWVSLVARRR